MTIQILLLVLAILIPLSWAVRWFGGDAPVVSMVVSLSMAVWALFCLVVLRRGQFRLAIGLFLGAFHLLLVISYAGDGLQAKLSSQVLHSIGLLLAALLIGRRVLWLAVLTLGVAIALGTFTDLRAGRSEVWVLVPRVVLSFLVIALVLDRFATASREMLQRETLRAAELAETHRQLSHEMHQRERLQLALGAAERAQSAELLAAGLTHELNNVLAQAYAQLDASEQVVPDGRQVLQPLRLTIDQTSTRIARILRLVRRDEAPRERFCPDVMLRSLEPRLRAVLEPGVSLQLQLEAVGELDMVTTDLAQIVLTLFNNAAAAVDSSGSVTVRLSEHSRAGRRGCLITVSDDGIGMDAQKLAAVGQVLFSSLPQQDENATGLGLMTCRALAERYGGRLHLQSTLGAGTQAEVWLPGPHSISSPVSETEQSVEVDYSKVLLVDDDQDVCALLSLVLGKAGFQVDIAETAQTARQAHRNYGARQPMLVMDRNLPDGDGVSLLEEFASQSRGLVAVFSSVQALRAHERDRLAHVKMVELAKPYAPDRMVAALRELIGDVA
jgi:signal transduction histidine kinase/ActR/RegA family two-component response regulator